MHRWSHTLTPILLLVASLTPVPPVLAEFLPTLEKEIARIEKDDDPALCRRISLEDLPIEAKATLLPGQTR